VPYFSTCELINCILLTKAKEWHRCGKGNYFVPTSSTVTSQTPCLSLSPAVHAALLLLTRLPLPGNHRHHYSPPPLDSLSLPPHYHHHAVYKHYTCLHNRKPNVVHVCHIACAASGLVVVWLSAAAAAAGALDGPRCRGPGSRGEGNVPTEVPRGGPLAGAAPGPS
jgi:hypothetical protein